MFPNNNPFGFPFFINTGQNSAPADPIDQMEKTITFMKKMRDMDKDEKKKDDKPKSLFSVTEYFMILLMCTSVIQTLLVVIMMRGK